MIGLHNIRHLNATRTMALEGGAQPLLKGQNLSSKLLYNNFMPILPQSQKKRTRKMVVASAKELEEKEIDKYDRTRELKAFDESKGGVKGLIDSGLARLPDIFVERDLVITRNNTRTNPNVTIPVLDLEKLGKDPERRQELINEIREASRSWGFFQVINHGIPQAVLDEIIEGIRRFHEQDPEVKKNYYTREEKKVVFNSNFDLYHVKAAKWRDTLTCVMAPNPPKPHELPDACRVILVDYTQRITRLGETIFELLSEALGLSPEHLKNIGCAEGLVLLGNYYPACPQPHLTLGTSSHTDVVFLTLLLQDHIGGLQVLHKDEWVDVHPVKGALIANIGDLMQLISNDKFVSVRHRVLANIAGPRISAVCFFRTQLPPENTSRLYRPLKELVSEDNPARYRETTVKDLVSNLYKRKDGLDPLDRVRL